MYLYYSLKWLVILHAGIKHVSISIESTGGDRYYACINALQLEGGDRYYVCMYQCDSTEGEVGEGISVNPQKEDAEQV